MTGWVIPDHPLLHAADSDNSSSCVHLLFPATRTLEDVLNSRGGAEMDKSCLGLGDALDPPGNKVS